MGVGGHDMGEGPMPHQSFGEKNLVSEGAFK